MSAPSAAPDEAVHLSVEGQTATITLDAPASRNALSQRLVGELTSRLAAADEEADVRVVVLTHTGNTFCAGADLDEALELGMEFGARALLGLLRTVVEMPTPVVAAVRGHVRAGGVGLVGACDLALVSDESSFAFSEALLGLTPAIISLTTLGRMRVSDAARKYLTGSTFDGREAAAAGLVTASVPDVAYDVALSELLAELVRVSPQGLRETKRLLNDPVRRTMAADGEALVELSTRLFASEEAREAMTAFRQRRAPRWAP